MKAESDNEEKERLLSSWHWREKASAFFSRIEEKRLKPHYRRREILSIYREERKKAKHHRKLEEMKKRAILEEQKSLLKYREARSCPEMRREAVSLYEPNLKKRRNSENDPLYNVNEESWLKTVAKENISWKWNLNEIAESRERG